MSDPSSEKGKESPAGLGSEIRATSPSSSTTDSPVEPAQYEEIRPAREKDVDADDEDAVAVDGGLRPDLSRLKSEATSVGSAPSTHVPEQKPWYKQPNPMRWGKIPPVPKEREVCREYQANFFSALTFGWMSPLMKVSGKDASKL